MAEFAFLLGNLTFSNVDLFAVWNSERGRHEREKAVQRYFELHACNNVDDNILKHKSHQFCNNLYYNWLKCHSSYKNFETKHSTWMKGNTTLPLKKSNRPVGRPLLPFESKGERAQRLQAAELSKFQGDDVFLLVHAATAAARKQGLHDLAAVLQILGSTPEKAKQVREGLTKPVDQPISASKDEALALILDQGLTKEQYCSIRDDIRKRNVDIYPIYKNVAEQKKQCRPGKINVSETVAKVSLQDLLEHTAFRIVTLQKDVIHGVLANQHTDFLSAELIVSYGFDGSTGQANYNQAYADKRSCNGDSCLFATTIMPLRLIDSSGNLLWNNRTPQSIRFCRPLKLEFLKETKEVILEESRDIQLQIEMLKSTMFKVSLNDTQFVYVRFSPYLTAIDGKVLNALTDTKSFQACPICHSSQRDFLGNKNFKCLKFLPVSDNLKYGVSPLHCWIRIFEFVLHAGYKLEVKKWPITDPCDKQAMLKRKASIQEMFWAKLALKVDKPKQGGFGNTNTGNTARRAFANFKKFSEITGVDQQIIYNLRIILICLSCQLPINLEKFEAYCHQTGEMIVDSYPWLPMTPTLHKIIVHSRQIMENTVLPVGCFGEEASESRNKIYKSDRLHHSRKHSRFESLGDVFKRALDTSDPVISSLNLSRRIKKHKNLSLPIEVIQLLSCEHEYISDFSEQDELEDNSLFFLENFELENEENDENKEN